MNISFVRWLLIFSISIVCSDAFSALKKEQFNQDWLYTESAVELDGISAASWQEISLPHTWNATDTVDSAPGYRRGVSWYKKDFKVSTKSKRYFIYFEGSNMETEVYLNGKRVGEHIGGYIGFQFELTPHLKKRGKNTLLVRVSNAYNPHLIPSQKSDFFIHGGITRDVWLIYKNDQLIENIAIQTPNIAKGDSSTELKVEMNAAVSKEVMLKTSILNANNSVVSENKKSMFLREGDNTLTVKVPHFEKVQLWSPATPNLYQLKTELVDIKTNKILDQSIQSFGYRWFELKEGKGFFVNNERVLLRGTHRHEEMGGVGAALSNEQHYQDMQTIKDMGANFVRLGHYPQDPEVYKAANELGLIIWDELPWCRGGIGGIEWKQNTEALLRSQIKQNYNHPSIAFWSLGNEIYWEADFEGGGAESLILPYLKKLNEITKGLDASRLTSIRKYYPGADVVDIFSPSIWAGWYGGSYGQYKTAIEKSTKKYPNFIHMEYGGSSHVGRHVEHPTDQNGLANAQVSVEEAMNQAVVKSIALSSDWNENYIVDLFDWHLNVSENQPGLTGTAQWSIRDFGTPLRPENPIPYVNQKGLLDRNGKPKDAYYVFASYWAKDPICYIESHSWTVRFGPKEGRDVNVYCNTDKAELFLNGSSLGEKTKDNAKFPAGGLVWKAPFSIGKNVLKVQGKSEEGAVLTTDQYSLEYHLGEPGKFDRIILSQRVLDNGNVLVEARAVDADGKQLISFSDRIYFSALGGNDLLFENYGSPSRSSIIEAANGYAAIELRPIKHARSVVIEAKTQNFKGVFLQIN